MTQSIRIETERQVLGEGAAFIKLSLPVLDGGTDSALGKRLAAYTERLKKGFLHYAGTKLLAASASRGGGAPYGGGLNTVLCHQSAGVLSFYIDATVTDGNGRRTHRLPFLWSVKGGTLIKPGRLFQKRAEKKLLPLILKGIDEKAAALSLPLYSDYAAIARRRFDTERFYISPTGAVFFYQGRTLNERPEPFALPLAVHALRPLLQEGAEELLWDGGEGQ